MSILDRDQCPASSFMNNNDLDASGVKNPGLAWKGIIQRIGDMVLVRWFIIFQLSLERYQ